MSKNKLPSDFLDARCVSVILPARDAGRTIGLAVNSILRQWGGQLLELLVIVEESDDATLAALGCIKDHRLRLELVSPGSSLTEKLNLGIERSTGSLIARMDADDIALPWRLTRQVSRLKNQKADLLFSTAWIFGRDLWPAPLIPQLPVNLRQTDVYHSLLTQNLLVHPTMLAKRALLQGIGGYRQVPAEDLDLWLRLAIYEAAMLRDWVPVLLYRFAKTSMSHTESHRMSVAQDRDITKLRDELARALMKKRSKPAPSNNTPAQRASWRLKVASLSFGRNH